MDELTIMRDVARRLESAGLPYMLTGSLAMSFYAQPRMTRDIDLVVELGEGDDVRVYDLFRDDYVVSFEAVREALAYTSMFNLIHLESVIKVDVIVRKDEPYRRVEFARRRIYSVDDHEVVVVSKEDLILSKLWWARYSFSEVQLRDVKNLVETGYDRPYVEHWLRELGLYEMAQPFLR